jgi:RimJ/RimL family protein N-acetyltransferase
VSDDLIARGRKVILRNKRVEDAEDDHRWRQDTELAELDASSVLRQSLKDFRRDLEQELERPTPWVKRYAIETHDGVHIGNCMVYDIDTISGQGELGILLGNRDYWNGGYGREAVTLLMDECFKMESMNRLYLHTLSWNARARRAFAGCGLREVGPDRRGGKDFILMEITRAECAALRSAETAATSRTDG